MIAATLFVFPLLSGVMIQAGTTCLVTNETAPFAVVNIAPRTNSIVIGFESCPDHVYQVESTGELSAQTVWTVQATMIGQNQSTTWEDTEVTGLAQKFWRVRRVSSDTDTDGDGMPNGWELRYGLNPLDPSDAHIDLNGDGVINLAEYLQGHDPTERPVADSTKLVNLQVFTPLE